MDSSQRDKKPSMGTLLNDVVDRMLRMQTAVPDRRTYNLTQKQANIRAVSVREGFQNMRARSDSMTQRLQHYRERHAASLGKPAGEAAPHEDTVKLFMQEPSAKN
jgi:hypothetical protein